MKPTEYEQKLQNLMNNVSIAISNGKEAYEEGYVEDVKKRANKAKEALEILLKELEKDQK
jgi:hypothetical protein